MKLNLVLLVTAAAIAGSALSGSAVAQDHGGRTDRMDRVERSDGNDMTANQLAAENDVRIARMKADLRLTADQEKNWAGIETALRDQGKRRADRFVAYRADSAKQTGAEDFVASMNRQADELSDRSTDMKKLAAAAQPLYTSLDDQQKKRFSHALMRMNRS